MQILYMTAETHIAMRSIEDGISMKADALEAEYIECTDKESALHCCIIVQA